MHSGWVPRGTLRPPVSARCATRCAGGAHTAAVSDGETGAEAVKPGAATVKSRMAGSTWLRRVECRRRGAPALAYCSAATGWRPWLLQHPHAAASPAVPRHITFPALCAASCTRCQVGSCPSSVLLWLSVTRGCGDHFFRPASFCYLLSVSCCNFRHHFLHRGQPRQPPDATRTFK
jgi:hypothetical protein